MKNCGSFLLPCNPHDCLEVGEMVGVNGRVRKYAKIKWRDAYWLVRLVYRRARIIGCVAVAQYTNDFDITTAIHHER